MDTHISKEILQKVRQVEIRTNRLVDDTLAGHYHSVFKGRAWTSMRFVSMCRATT